MKKLREILSLVLSVLLLAALHAGCGQKPAASCADHPPRLWGGGKRSPRPASGSPPTERKPADPVTG